MLNNVLGVLGELDLNGLIANSDPTGLTTVKRTGDQVTATGQGNLLNLNVLPLGGLLSGLGGGLLANVPALPAGNLAAINLVKGSASVTLDGVSAPVYGGGGQLGNISILGTTALSLDSILPVGGQSCKIVVFGTGNSCNGVPLDSILGAIPNPLGSPGAGLITIVLSRGILTHGVNDSPTQAQASVTALAVDVQVDCSVLGTLLNGPLQGLNGIAAIQVCPGGARKDLVSLGLGHAEAAVTVNTTTSACTPIPCGVLGVQTPVNTGSNDWILAAVAVVLAGAGIGINRRRRGLPG